MAVDFGQDRDNCHLGILSTILQHFTDTMKSSDPLLLANVTLRWGMYPAGKVDISQHLTILLSASTVWTLHRGAFCQLPFRWIYYCPGSKSMGKETGKIDLCALVHCVLKHSRPPNLKPSSNLSLPFSWIRGPATDPNFSRVHILLLLNTYTLRISLFF